MSDHSGGDPGPAFVDVYGTSRRLGMDIRGSGGNDPHGFEGPHPDGPFWKRGLQGTLPLWVAFWAGFFFGHGIIISFSVGVLLIGTVLGLAVDPTRVNESITMAWMVGGLVAGVMSIFAIWAMVSVWRCAPNADEKKWGVIARCVVVTYALLWTFTIYRIAT